MTEQNLRHLTIKSNEVQVVHGGKIMNPGAIGHLRSNAIVHVLDKISGGGKKKGQRKSNHSPSDQGVSADLIEQVLKN